MSRILLLIPLILWMAWPRAVSQGDFLRPIWFSLLLYLTGYLILVLLMAGWARQILSKAGSHQLYRRISRFNRGMFLARLVVLLWMGVGLFFLGWRVFVGHVLGLDSLAFDLPSLLVGVAPCYLAWMGLWWSQYPTERAVREQGILINFDHNLPVHQPPGWWSYFTSHLRLQILFTLAPVVLILAIVDVVNVAMLPLVRYLSPSLHSAVQQGVIFAAVAMIYLFSPELLRRLLRTSPLPDSPLRRQLLQMAQRQGLRVRDILLWQTHHNICNAAVMGLLGRFRYVLLTDLLLETMTDEQIEAVFAHEVGHVVHRHMLWYVLIIVILVLTLTGVEPLLGRFWPGMGHTVWLGLSADLWLTGLATVAFILGFGFLSRRFERQADVFAARVIEQFNPVRIGAGSDFDSDSRSGSRQLAAVGPYGAGIFSSALNRVASINNIPTIARRWGGGSFTQYLTYRLDRCIEWANHFLHGSIVNRVSYLQNLGGDREKTARFDQSMKRLYSLLLILLAGAIMLVCYGQIFSTV